MHIFQTIFNYLSAISVFIDQRNITLQRRHELKHCTWIGRRLLSRSARHRLLQRRTPRRPELSWAASDEDSSSPVLRQRNYHRPPHHLPDHDNIPDTLLTASFHINSNSLLYQHTSLCKAHNNCIVYYVFLGFHPTRATCLTNPDS